MQPRWYCTYGSCSISRTMLSPSSNNKFRTLLWTSKHMKLPFSSPGLKAQCNQSSLSTFAWNNACFIPIILVGSPGAFRAPLRPSSMLDESSGPSRLGMPTYLCLCGYMKHFFRRVRDEISGSSKGNCQLIHPFCFRDSDPGGYGVAMSSSFFNEWEVVQQ